MAGTVEQKLASQGITLHEPPNPVANYVPFVRSGNLLFVSGQVCLGADGKLIDLDAALPHTADEVEAAFLLNELELRGHVVAIEIGGIRRKRPCGWPI